MRVTYLKLKNFVNIFAGMKKKEIEIDLSDSINKLIVLIGPNGSGKTSILSELHPFANSGNMDIRSDTNLIMDGCDGYKEIHIKDGDDLYVIKHTYMYKNKTKSVKSFISKNNEELNANGNVKSFKEAVNEHLGLDQDLMKLMRLGSNVTSLAKMKSTNRKSFATKLFSDIDIYNGFYKKASEEYRNLRAMLKNLSSKIDKYNVSDSSEFESQLESVEKDILKYESRKDELMKLISSLETKFDDIDISDELTVTERYRYLEDKINSANSLLTLVSGINMSKAEYELQKEREKNTLETKIMKCRSEINTKISERDIYYTQKQELEDELKTAVSDVRVKQLQSSIKEYSDKISEMEKNMVDRTKYVKAGLLELKHHVNKTLEMYNSLNCFSAVDVKKIASAILNSHNIKEYIELSRTKMKDSYDKLNSEIITIENIDIDLDGFEIPDNSCKHDCPYKEFYNNVMNKRHNLGKLVEERNKISKELRSCDSLYELYNLITLMGEHIDSYSYDGKLPIVYTQTDVLVNMSQGKPLVNMNLLNLAIDDSETFDEIERLKSSMESIENEYVIVKEYSVDVIELENKILEIDEITTNKTKDINSLEVEIDEVNKELETINEETKNILEALELKDSLSDIEREFNDKKYRLSEIENSKTQKSVLSYVIQTNQKELQTISNYLSGLVSRREQISFNLKNYLSITEEYNGLSLLFEDADDIKKSLNSSEGIPLLYLQVYLKNCPIMMNSLLENIFDGKIQIEDFNIDDNEFSIPFKNDGIVVPDIVFASQGESSFISIVLSLSLIVQSMTKYDIICLDELDGPLDTKNREEFIKILYAFIEEVNCEQIFLISHNNMFDNEPVDIIQTANTDTDNFKYGKVVFNGGK